MRLPWVSRKRLEASERESARFKSQLELLQWWLRHESIEVPGSSEIMSIMGCEIAVSKRPAVLRNITDGPSMLDRLCDCGRVGDADG